MQAKLHFPADAPLHAVASPSCACTVSRVGKANWHLSLRMMVSLPSCPARHVASPDMSERQCSGDVLPGLHSTLASALADSEPCVQAARVYSPACNKTFHLESLSERQSSNAAWAGRGVLPDLAASGIAAQIFIVGL